MNGLLAYMRGTLEGKEGLPVYIRWFHDHGTELEKLLGRGGYLRLKLTLDPLAEFREILKRHQVEFSEVPEAHLPGGPADFSWIQPEWLTERIFPYRRSPTEANTLPMAHADEFLHMIEVKESGDELWRFITPPSRVEMGIALVREGRVVYAITEWKALWY